MSDTGGYAWYYNAGDGVAYWGLCCNMSCLQFAKEISPLVNKNLQEKDIGQIRSRTEFEKTKKRVYRKLIEIK